jgi:hypothetical protein
LASTLTAGPRFVAHALVQDLPDQSTQLVGDHICSSASQLVSICSNHSPKTDWIPALMVSSDSGELALRTPEVAGGPPDPAMLRALSVDWLKWNRVADLCEHSGQWLC